MGKALIVIDVQSYFLRRSPADLPARIRNHILTNDYTLVAFTIFQNTPDSNWVRSLHWEKCQSEEDLQLAPELQEFTTAENTFTKTAYSGFAGTHLNTFLQTSEIESIELCGIDTDSCVLATAFDAFDRGYRVQVLFDLCYSRWHYDENAKSIILKNFSPQG